MKRKAWMLVVVFIGMALMGHASTETRTYQLKTELFEKIRLNFEIDHFRFGSFSRIEITPRQLEEIKLWLSQTHRIRGGIEDVTGEPLFYPLEKKKVTTRDDFSFSDANKFFINDQINKLNFNRFNEYLNSLTEFYNRSASEQTGVEAANWIKEKMESIANETQTPIQVMEIPSGWYKQPSVVVRVMGMQPELPAVVVGGHFDTLGRGRKPGADDNGSGSAAVVEIYHTLLESQKKFKRDLYFAFYAAEEVGLVGSKKVVLEFVKKKIPVRSVLQLDMIGYQSPKDDKEIYFIMDYVDVELTRFTQQLAQLYLGFNPSELGESKCGYACSDHASWNRQGFSSVFLAESSYKNHNPVIHTANDSIETINMNHAQKFIKLGLSFAIELAEPLLAAGCQ